MKWSVINIVLAVAAGVVLFNLVDAPTQTRLGLALFVFIAWLWISEALHISVTALLVPLIASLLGLTPVPAAFENFAHPVIFLFMGGFALAAALRKHELDRAFAVRLLALSNGRPGRAILLMFVATAFLSMWISNTATVAMMLPLVLGLLATRDPEREPRLFLFALLGLAYSGNLGGMATLIGSPPNAIASSAMGLSFTEWLAFGLPAFLLLFPIMIVLLYLSIRPTFGESLQLARHDPVPDRRRRLVPIDFRRHRVRLGR
ncbi:MAG: SLC13 family permease [Gammaproteobacteria bacterium]|nr:SLC13 family permease [Gammaproteobacteria bacterium]